MQRGNSHSVDLRQIPAPRRHPAVFSTFSFLEPGESILLTGDHDPKPLFHQFQMEMRGEFEWTYIEEGPEVWRVEILKLEPPALQAHPEPVAMLLREHREIEEHLAAARQWLPVLQQEGAAAVETLRDRIRAFGEVMSRDLAEHLAKEERSLFPVLGRYIGDETGPVGVMMKEHRKLKSHEAMFREGLQTGSPELLARGASGLISVLTEHIGKEDETLFPLAVRNLSGDDWQEVLSLMLGEGA